MERIPGTGTDYRYLVPSDKVCGGDAPAPDLAGETNNLDG
jgi:hypothetical protein